MDTIDVQEIPLISISNQQLSCTLDGQNCLIAVYQRNDYIYLDLSVGQTPIRRGAICLPYCPIITGASDFKGQFYIVDTTAPFDAQTKPHYSGLGERYKLYYLNAQSTETINAAKHVIS